MKTLSLNTSNSLQLNHSSNINTKTCYTSLNVVLKNNPNHQTLQTATNFLSKQTIRSKMFEINNKTQTINTSIYTSGNIKTVPTNLPKLTPKSRARKIQYSSSSFCEAKVQKELTKFKKENNEKKPKPKKKLIYFGIEDENETLTERPKPIKNLRTILQKSIYSFGKYSKKERANILKTANKNIPYDLSQSIRLCDKFYHIAEGVKFDYPKNEKKTINESIFHKLSLKDEVTFQIQINTILQKNAKRQQFKERILRVMLSAAAHLTRLGLSLSSFFETNNENIPKGFQNDFKILLFAIKDNDYERVKSLIEDNKFLVQMFDDFKQTPLHVAAKRNRGDIIKYIISKGAKIDLEDCTGKTALHIACMYSMVENVKVLLFEYASPFKMDHNGKYPSDYATDNVIKFFLERTKTLVNFNLKLNIQESLKRIRIGLKFFFDLPVQDLKKFI